MTKTLKTYILCRSEKEIIRSTLLSKGYRLRLITPTSTLIILDITKASSNNCLLSVTKFYLTLKHVTVIVYRGEKGEIKRKRKVHKIL